MVQSVAHLIRDLEPEDFYLLSGIEHGMRFGEWVNREELPKFSRLTPEDVEYRLDRCLERELIQRKTMQYEGYQLKFEGYDALALHTFAERDVIEGFGAPLGVGKESDVYEVTSYKPLALKFHREGITNFREVQRDRDYTSDHRHRSWLYTARKAAEREYQVLEALYPQVRVPRPVDHNRHAIVMELIDGVELSRVRLEPDQVKPVLDMILRETDGAYDAGYVHADLSQYNIFVGEEGITIFDWPQAIPVEHENSNELLSRDIGNVLKFFSQKYPGALPAIDEAHIIATIRDGTFESIDGSDV